MEQFISDIDSALPELEFGLHIQNRENYLNSRIIGDNVLRHIVAYFIKKNISPDEFTPNNLKEVYKLFIHLSDFSFDGKDFEMSDNWSRVEYMIDIVYCGHKMSIDNKHVYQFIVDNIEYANEKFNLENIYIFIDNKKICLAQSKEMLIEHIKQYIETNCIDPLIYAYLYQQLCISFANIKCCLCTV